MADSIREKAMQALETLLATVTGFSAEQVERTATAAPTEGTYPRIDVREGMDTSFEKTPDAPHQKAEHQLVVVLQVWVSGPDAPQKRLNNHKADIEKKLKTHPNYKLTAGVWQLHVTGSDSQVSRDQQFNSMYISILVKYRHVLDDPYTP